MARTFTSAKARCFTESVIREMTRLALRHGAVNLAQGFPDFAAPAAIKNAAKAAIDADRNQYAITWGTKNLRDAIAARAKSYNGIDVDPETMVTVCCGATEAMIATMLATVDPGEEVIIFEPFYENYGPDCILSGAQPVFHRLEAPDFAIDFDALAKKFTPRTKAIVLNTPNNPTGKVFTRDELQRIATLCQEHDCLAITDEIYEYILYDGAQHVSLATLPGMAERTVTISGHSKTFSVTGWRIGYAIAPPAITAAIRKVHDFLTVGAPHPLQEAAAAALAFPPQFFLDLGAAYTKRRDRLFDGLSRANFNPVKPKGAYYIMADIGHFGFRDDVAFAKHLVETVGVAGVPGSSFFRDPEAGKRWIRFCFPKQDSTIDAALERLAMMQ
ncbi:MAG: aminotransferase class I/II-fold pyridoxal phosphate-dependent enzyme [Planctomycetes bacterium]|nr:aminotransferase class I/II-fold pyridoxal phosphate-dependent enzyme [Planctomycetota bacterium]MCC7172195.1 aminotransferase class I/II-fold pyridoxal phosphate-dependent enzyme [Planctomycetota bacterium]